MTWWVAVLVVGALFGLGWLVALARLVLSSTRHPRHRKDRRDHDRPRR